MSYDHYAMKVRVSHPYAKALETTRRELSAEGFGILTEINVTETLRKKLDVAFRPYVILGACNPPLAHKALSEELDVGLLLPCNVIVYEDDDPTQSIVAAIDPVTQLEVTGRKDIVPLAREVQTRLRHVVDRIAAA